MQKYAINLAIYICYYIRVSNKKLREKFAEKLTEVFKYRNFLDIPLLEMEFITDNIDIPKGIAKNKALTENIFSLFCAINARIPLFIVGKPGCSKSLSVQLIYKSMKGNSSKNEFFKNFPKLVVFSYQGSLTSTSEGVETIFKRANNTMERFKKENKGSISMIFFDEMGLAEHSPNNPLKVIHSQLEIDSERDKNPKAAFIGISNWVLDAAKMNRGLHISIPELDEEDIINTSKRIAESYNKELVSKFEKFFIYLGKTYYEYKIDLKKKHYLDGKEDFHGNRDFFHFIKYASREISKDINNIKESELSLIGLKSIERNFAGLKLGHKDSVTIVKEKFKEVSKYNIDIKEYDSIHNIKENKNEDNSRYLLLISNSSESCYLLSSILEGEDYIFILGSQFIEDFNSEEYQLKVIKRIQIYMEEEKTIILKDLESVYPALYDLFNQNFTIMNGKNFARISIGSSFSIYSKVNKKFKCIVNVDINNISKQEPPFLNRFEKHIVTYSNLLNDDLTIIANKIFDNFQKIVDSEKEFIMDNYDFKKILINLDLEEIKGLVYKASKNHNKENNENYEKKIIEEVLSKLALTLPQDVIFQIKYNKNIMYRELIFKYYLEGEHMNLEKFLINMKNKKNVIYTFNKILDKIDISYVKNTNLHFEINGLDNFKIIKIGGIKSEKEYEKNIDEFFNDDKYKICLIHFSPEESNLINYTKFFIENKEKEYQNNSKIFILIVHVSRIFNYELENLKKDKRYQEILNKKVLKQTISNLSEYYQIFIDNLNGDKELSLETIIKLEGNQIFNYFLNVNKILKDNIHKSLSFFKYNILYSFGNLNKDNYKNYLIKYIEEDENIRKQINGFINNNLLKERNSNKITSENSDRKGIQIEISEKDIDIISILKYYLSNLYNSHLVKIIFKFDKFSIFSSILSINEEELLIKKNKENEISSEDFNDSIKIVSKISGFFFENLPNEEIKITEKINSNIVDIILGLKIPGIRTSFENIIKKINKNVIRFHMNEFNLRIKNNHLEEEEIENNYWKELIRLCHLTTLEIKKENYISKIMEKLDEKDLYLFYEILINDYYIFFINNNLNYNFKNSKSLSIESIRRMLVLLIKTKNKKYGNKVEEKEEEEEEEENKIKLKNKNKLREIANTINWIECYKKEITIILRTYAKMNLKIKNLYELVKDNIINKNIKYEISERSPQYTEIINEIIFLGIESLLKILINEKLLEDINDDEKLIELINYYREILQDISKMQNNLMLYSKEMSSLEEIVEIFDLYYNNKINKNDKINKKECLIEIFKYFSNEAEILNEKIIDIPYLKMNFSKFYKTLCKYLEKDKNFPKIMNIIFINEFKKINNKDFRKGLMKMLIEKDEYIYNSSYLIELILDDYLNHDLTNFKDNIKTIENCKLIKFLNNNCKNKILEEMLINSFEFHINLYFKEIDKKFKKREEIIKYLIEKEDENDDSRPFSIFNKYINMLNDKANEKENEKNNDKEKDKKGKSSVYKLYLISFIKIYLNKISYYYMTSGNQLNINDIIDIIVKINNEKFRIVIKYYFFKLLYNYSSNYQEFKQVTILDDIIFSDRFIKENMNDNNEILTYNFLPSNTKDDLKKYSKISQEYEKKINENQLQNILNNNSLDMFIILILNKII